ncbi:glycosyltransferase family 2 protein [Devosia algicola]|uniref:Glycosyltransferase family 2 protein n=1 Tax=Devosia algicola TaxID=3026418 RepID=A0ABY7YQR3_9HYPH|nr:glycosyltransferase family 2 protein [Devosia algicola]WDR03537.1 glycosyltransferase family 2 protein [Devosia algicola]
MCSNRPDAGRSSAPLISVVMANYQAGAKIVPAIESVLRQTIGKLELIVCDDASTDNSVGLVERFVQSDTRVRLIRAKANSGPARCRNRGFEAARGRWIAIVDSDDIIHHERLERLVAAANQHGAAIVADDLLHFYEDGSPATLLLDRQRTCLFEVEPEQWIRSGFDGTAPLGYLKPLIRADVLGDFRYDESLRIGEDYDLVLRLLLGGTKMIVVPEPFYLYRRHRGSISHRLSPADLEAMISSQNAMVDRLSDLPWPLVIAFAVRHAKLKQSLQFEHLVQAIKGRKPVQALSLMLAAPPLVGLLLRSFVEGRLPKNTAGYQPIHDPLALKPDDVPAYHPIQTANWAEPRPRQAWVDLANVGRGRPIVVVCTGRAAHYAAGFIPLACVQASDSSTNALAPVT